MHCAAPFKGGNNLEDRWVCTLSPTEIRYSCINKGGNADTANSHIFVPSSTTLTQAEFGREFTLFGKGKFASDIEFTDEDIISALAEVGIVLKPEDLCPNRNFKLQFVITSMSATTNLLVTQDPNNSCVPSNPTTCDTSVNGVPEGCSQTECYSFDPCSKPDPTSFERETYNCTCTQHYEKGVLFGPGPNC